jgi:hypothetical protein
MSSTMPGSRRGGPASEDPPLLSCSGRGRPEGVQAHRRRRAREHSSGAGRGRSSGVGGECRLPLLLEAPPPLVLERSRTAGGVRLTFDVERASPAPARRRTETELRCGTTLRRRDHD